MRSCKNEFSWICVHPRGTLFLVALVFSSSIVGALFGGDTEGCSYSSLADLS